MTMPLSSSISLCSLSAPPHPSPTPISFHPTGTPTCSLRLHDIACAYSVPMLPLGIAAYITIGNPGANYSPARLDRADSPPPSADEHYASDQISFMCLSGKPGRINTMTAHVDLPALYQGICDEVRQGQWKGEYPEESSLTYLTFLGTLSQTSGSGLSILAEK
ncbi:hypothetical protein BO94DRAFT_545744 [Aspergillus sclerotioniger CBS 115572]|uniref:Uncharacterized protein n=1 Tax=Aspergillus sclerotioniger CBS 115572 TaxID=1450535 RepID=A0A317WQD4_9EURO|nr:hypothetical protein BO94DRAFT_545744 [Aspergillus sclerotioniger CBS 115572]PWY88643.1 hypothetical protein BO94DRAFT_545744 [Aspergillus sclerotioniger CBS 115572]